MDVAAEEVPYVENFRDGLSAVIIDHLGEYSLLIVKALHVSSPLAVKEVALDSVQRLCKNSNAISENSNSKHLFL